MRSQKPTEITISKNTSSIFNLSSRSINVSHQLIQELRLAEDKLSIARDKVSHLKDQHVSATGITKEYMKQMKTLQEKILKALERARSHAGMEAMQKANEENDLIKKMDLGIKGINLIAEEKSALKEAITCQSQLEKLSDILSFAIDMVNVAETLYKEADQEYRSSLESFASIKTRFDKQMHEMKVNNAWVSLLSTEDDDLERRLFKNVL